MTKPLSISEARSKLPQIAQSLVREAGAVVYIEHRDLDERLAVTTESHLRYLETMVEQLRQRVARPFSLAGSIETELSAEGVEAEIAALRMEAAGTLDGKLDAL